MIALIAYASLCALFMIAVWPLSLPRYIAAWIIFLLMPVVMMGLQS